MRQNFYVFSRYSNPDQDHPILYCFLTSMAAVQTEDVSDSFLFGERFELPSSRVVGFNDPETSWCCSRTCVTAPILDQLLVGPTHARGGTVDLLMTEVPDIVRVAVVAPIGNSD